MDKPAKSAALLSRGLFHRIDMPIMVGKTKSMAIGMRMRWYFMLSSLVLVSKVCEGGRSDRPGKQHREDSYARGRHRKFEGFLGSVSKNCDQETAKTDSSVSRHSCPRERD